MVPFLEAEVEILGFYDCVLLGSFCLQVDGITLNVNSLYGADEFAAAASYAQVRGGFGDGKTSLERNHMDSLDGTVLGAGSATGTVYVDNTDVYVKYYAARLGLVLLLNSKRLYGAGWTYLAAQIAVIVTVSLIKLHDRLHDASQSVFQTRGFEYVAGTLAYAQMACGAMLQQVFVAQ